MPVGPLIAVIDDDKSAREAIVGLVRSLGFVIVAFESAADFLQSDKILRTSCLIADVQMPGMTGLALYQHLVVEGISIPAVLITAFPDEVTRMQALRSGVRAFLVKPIDPNDLHESICSVLANQK